MKDDCPLWLKTAVITFVLAILSAAIAVMVTRGLPTLLRPDSLAPNTNP